MSRYCVMIMVMVLASCTAGGGERLRAGDVCWPVGDSVCQRMVECGVAPDRDSCLVTFYDVCCAHSYTCGQRSVSDLVDVIECQIDLGAYPCALIGSDAAPVPASCKGVAASAP